MKKLFLLVCILSLIGCGGDESDGHNGSRSFTGHSSLTFWAMNLTTSSYTPYKIMANLAGEGTHCYVYLESGRFVNPATIQNILTQFDTVIYPKMRNAYGDEPNPGIDNDPKIYILLLDIKDGWNGITITGYTAGYFYSLDQYENQTLPINMRHSNEKDIFYMDITPGLTHAGLTQFTHTLAHEFQHMIHWNNKNGDDDWLDEAMSEVAPFYAFGTTSSDRVEDFKNLNHSDSLTDWGPGNNGYGTLADYAVAYMWAQYMADRFPGDVFRNIISGPGIGTGSVDNYLTNLGGGENFESVFLDWSRAIFFGNGSVSNPVSTTNALWKYNSINTWSGNPRSLFNFSSIGHLNVSSFNALDRWSLGYYHWNNASLIGSFTWNTTVANHASLYTSGLFTPDHLPTAASGIPGTYLILQNAQNIKLSPSILPSPDSGWISATQQSAPPTPMEKLQIFSQQRKAAKSKSSLMRMDATQGDNSNQSDADEPIPVCMHDILSRRVKEITRQNQDAH